MSRLDHHVSHVQNKLTLRMFIHALAWAAAGLAGVIWVVVRGGRGFAFHFSRPGLVVLLGCAAGAIGALVFAIVRRPSQGLAAVAIDDALGLKEKFSTALYARTTSNDPFALAVVRDAERAADNVSLYNRFPLQFPRQV